METDVKDGITPVRIKTVKAARRIKHGATISSSLEATRLDRHEATPSFENKGLVVIRSDQNRRHAALEIYRFNLEHMRSFFFFPAQNYY